jgi:hypothetical protein
MTENLEFGKLAARLVIGTGTKNTTECFSEVMEHLYNKCRFKSIFCTCFS